MNVHLEGVQYTDIYGKLHRLNNVYIRGSKIRYMIVPDMLREAPMFKRIDPRNRNKKGNVALGMGRGMKEIIQAQMGLVSMSDHRRRRATLPMGRGGGMGRGGP